MSAHADSRGPQGCPPHMTQYAMGGGRGLCTRSTVVRTAARRAGETSPRIRRRPAARPRDTKLTGLLTCYDVGQARSGSTASGVADRSLSYVSARLTPRLTWAFAWQVMGSNHRRLSRRFYIRYLPNMPWPADMFRASGLLRVFAVPSGRMVPTVPWHLAGLDPAHPGHPVSCPAWTRAMMRASSFDVILPGCGAEVSC